MAYPSEYYRPETLEQAVEVALRPNTIAIAGGAFTFTGITLPFDVVVDLQSIAQLKQIEQVNGAIKVGSTASLQDIVESKLILPELKIAITRSIPLNIRNRTSTGESLLVPDPPREWLAILTVLGSSVEHYVEQVDVQYIPLEQIAEEAGQLIWMRGVVSSVTIPLLEANEAVGQAHVARTPTSEPIVNVAAYVQVDDSGDIAQARAVFGGASASDVTMLNLSLGGFPLDAMSVEGALELVATEIDPVDDYLGSAEYRREMATVCVRRALMQCVATLTARN